MHGTGPSGSGDQARIAGAARNASGPQVSASTRPGASASSVFLAAPPIQAGRADSFSLPCSAGGGAQGTISTTTNHWPEAGYQAPDAAGRAGAENSSATAVRGSMSDSTAHQGTRHERADCHRNVHEEHRTDDQHDHGQAAQRIAARLGGRIDVAKIGCHHNLLESDSWFDQCLTNIVLLLDRRTSQSTVRRWYAVQVTDDQVTGDQAASDQVTGGEADGKAGDGQASDPAAAPIPPPPWQRLPDRPARRRREPISRDAIVEAALRLLDRDGLDALSMRRVADELGTGAASLYWHVGSKDGLLDLVFDRVIGEQQIPDPDPKRWKEQLKEVARAQREASIRHPYIVRISIGRIPMGPNALSYSERVLAILRAGGVPPRLAVQGQQLLMSAVNGFTLDETGVGEPGDGPASRAGRPARRGGPGA